MADELPFIGASGHRGIPTKANQLANFPLNFLRTGLYSYDGKEYYRTSTGYWRPITNISTTHSNGLRIDTSSIAPQNNNVRGSGLARRCVDQCHPKANQLANFPLNFLRTGDYFYTDGKLYYRTAKGYWWSATRSSAMYANNLGTETTTAGVYPQLSNYRGYAFALCCVLSSALFLKKRALR